MSPSSPPAPYFTLPYPIPHLLLRRYKASLEVTTKSGIVSWRRTRLMTPVSRLSKVFHHREGISQSQFMHLGKILVPLLRLYKQTKPDNCHPLSEWLAWFHIGSPAVRPESPSSCYLGSAVFKVFQIITLMSPSLPLIWSLLPLLS